jgi:diaminohydroxyphosphoribosylaminopyrimidine deaminase/5-amino-6-(5-phosphoribosylamino)uracil reductase
MDDTYFLAEAFRLAEKGLYTADPNPRVGCVLVKDNRIVGRGYHLTTGEGHAEANALAQAGESSRGATAFVTLEPCSFHGRTPSCALSLIEAGVVRVVAAMADPHEKNAGTGFQILRKAGIEVRTPLLESSARALNPGHIKRYETGLPFVRLKLAMSLDGKTALANGESHWITGPEARRDVQKLRARSSAIVTGVQTVIDDNPRMTVRVKDLETQDLDSQHCDLAAKRRRPVYILDPRLRVPPDAEILKSPDNILVCIPGEAGKNTYAASVLEAEEDADHRIHLGQFLRHLVGDDCNEVLFECGPTLGGSLIQQGLCDELIIYIAPKIMGSSSRSLLNVPEIDSMGDLFNMNIIDCRSVGSDIRITAVPNQTG